MTDKSIQLYDPALLASTAHHPAMHSLVTLLCRKTGNLDRSFFQAEVAYFLSLVPSAMRAKVVTIERNTIPLNVYSIALATSGFGKGHSVNIMERVIAGFRKKFTQDTFNTVAKEALEDLAKEVAIAKGTDEDNELKNLQLEFKQQGHAPFIFDSGTGPAVKQLRHKLLMAKAGSINFQMDEIGSNLQSNNEVLNVLLELYDVGKIKAKLVKNTHENERGMDLVGDTPANMLMFGTTSKLLDGSRTEEEFFSFLETGYARRCFFGVGSTTTKSTKESVEEIYATLTNNASKHEATNLAAQLAALANIANYGKRLTMDKETSMFLISYKLHCENEAALMPEHEIIRQAECTHRYFKSLKLAGVYAFIDGSDKVTIEHLLQAIKVTEDSGRSLSKILKRERNFVRLARYIVSSPTELTNADLVDDLPYYPNAANARREMLDLAMAWGVGHHVVIKRNIVQGIEFFSGSALEETDLNKLSFSFSDHFAYDYQHEQRKMGSLKKLLATKDLHWCNHAFENEHRAEENAIEGFNLIVIDVDGTARLEAVHELLKEYTFITATTKRHTEDEHRFRLIMPANYILKLDKADYKEFMDSFLLWLPFESDDAANQRSKKWLTHAEGDIFYNEGTKLIDVMPFIPKTKQNKEYISSITDLGNLSNLERWFLGRMEIGDRNNQLLRYGMILHDAGMEYGELESKVVALNERTTVPLPKEEVQSTVLKSIASKGAKK